MTQTCLRISIRKIGNMLWLNTDQRTPTQIFTLHIWNCFFVTLFILTARVKSTFLYYRNSLCEKATKAMPTCFYTSSLLRERGTVWTISLVKTQLLFLTRIQSKSLVMSVKKHRFFRDFFLKSNWFKKCLRKTLRICAGLVDMVVVNLNLMENDHIVSFQNCKQTRHTVRYFLKTLFEYNGPKKLIVPLKPQNQLNSFFILYLSMKCEKVKSNR